MSQLILFVLIFRSGRERLLEWEQVKSSGSLDPTATAAFNLAVPSDEAVRTASACLTVREEPVISCAEPIHGPFRGGNLLSVSFAVLSTIASI